MNVLVTGAFKNYELLRNTFSDKCNFYFIQNELEELNIDCSSFDYVICNALFLHNDIKKFKSLKYIQVTSVGLDRLPMDYIKKNNIKIYNAGGIYSLPMAEWVICKILDAYKKSFILYENQKQKIWDKQRDIKELSNQKVAIIGYGNIGKQIAKRLSSFDMEIIAVDLVKKEDTVINQFYSIKDLSKALNEADIVILTLPLLDSTIGLFNKTTLSSMKYGSVLVNVSRGKIIKEIDLIQEIKKGRFFSVILDVFEDEPLSSESELWNFENVIITPHNSFVSNNNDYRLTKLIIENLKEVLS